MSHHLLTNCSVVLLILTLLLVLCDIDGVKSTNIISYYIIPRSNSSCPREGDCLTLLQFAAKSRIYYRNDTNITLYFLPGHHCLNRELSLMGIHNLTMTKDVSYNYTGGNDVVTVSVECTCHRERGSFNISMTVFVSIKDMQFIGCGPNAIAHVRRFILKDSTFLILPWVGSQLMLNEVANASILRSSFVFHEVGIGYTMVYALRSLVFITNSTFSNARVSSGGVMDISLSKLIVANSLFINNRAYFSGGVIAMTKSLFYVYNSLFVNNTASYTGGVLYSIYSSFHIIYCYFRGNNALFYGGAVYAINSTFIITKSDFVLNSGGGFGGVIYQESSLHLTLQMLVESWKSLEVL